MGYFRPLSQTKFINDANLVSYWTLDGNSNDSKGSNNGTDTSISYSTANAVASNFGQGASLNGTTSNISTPDSALGIGSAFTFSFWIKTSAITEQGIYCRDTVGVLRAWQFRVDATTGVLRLVRFDSGGGLQTNFATSTAVNTGNYTHVVATWNTTAGAVLYINGKNSGTDSNVTAQNNNTGVTPKIGIGTGAAATGPFNGTIDDGAVFSRALSSGEVAELYQSQTLGEYLGAGGSTQILENFNSYSNGNLTGQGGWSGDTDFQVQGTTVQEGAKAIKCAAGYGTDRFINKNITAQTSGIFGFYMRFSATGLYNCAIQLRSGSTNKASIYIRNDACALVDGTGSQTQSLGTSQSTNTWYLCEIQIDQSANRFRGRLNSGTWSAWIVYSFTSIDNIQMVTAFFSGQDAFYDYITFTPTSNTKLLLHLNGSSADSSGNSNNGTDTSITYSQANGKFGQGAGFNGSSSFISFANTGFPLGATSFTNAIWFKSSSTSSQAIYGYGTVAASGNRNVLGLFNTGKFYFTGFGADLDSGFTVSDGNWHRGVVTYNGTTMILYVDGVQRGSGSVSLDVKTGTSVFLGKTAQNDSFFNGAIDEAVFENGVVWSAEKVKKDYTYNKGRFGII